MIRAAVSPNNHPWSCSDRYEIVLSTDSWAWSLDAFFLTYVDHDEEVEHLTRKAHALAQEPDLRWTSPYGYVVVVTQGRTLKELGAITISAVQDGQLIGRAAPTLGPLPVEAASSHAHPTMEARAVIRLTSPPTCDRPIIITCVDPRDQDSYRFTIRPAPSSHP